MKLKLLIGLWIGLITQTLAQTFPVQSITELTPPYSLYLADYVAPGSNKVAVNLLLTDFTQTSYRVKLHLVIEGLGITIRTKPTYLPPPITLQPGATERLTGSDLAGLFDPNNLIFLGFSKAEYEKTKKLPEGVYRISFQVLDYDRSTSVSNPQAGASTAWLILNDPPLLNLPQNEEKIKPLEPQNVVFQWTPRHTASPNTAFNVQYEFTLVWIQPKGANPNNAILSSQPIYQTTTSATTLVYGIAEPNLIAGEQYAWRVRALQPDGIDLFKNSGYSEVRIFSYGDKCLQPLNIQAEAPASTRIRLSWETNPGNSSFKVRYREKADGAEWFEQETSLTYLMLNNLKAGTVYEYQVASVCQAVKGDYSPVQSIQTPEMSASDFFCGAPMAPFDLSNRNLKDNLSKGDIIKAMDFDVQITQIEGNNGIFSGQGFIIAGMLNRMKLKVVFENIMVNEENRMIEGKIAVVGSTIQVLDDSSIEQMNALLTEIDEALDDLENALDVVDMVLAKLDAIVDKFIQYLPEDKAIKLTSARDRLEKAKEAWQAIKNDPTATQEEKDKAKQELKDAKNELVDAFGDAVEYYGEAIKRFINIIWQAIKELKQEIAGNKAEEEYNSAKNEIENSIYTKQGLQKIESTPDTSNFMFIGSLHEESDLEEKQESQKAFSESAEDYWQKKKALMYVKAFTAFFVFYASENTVKDAITKDVTLQGAELVDDVLIKMKEGQSDEQIKNYIKDYIKNIIVELAEYLLQEDE